MDNQSEEQQAAVPLEVLWKIFEYLDLETLLNECPYVSRSWNEASMHDTFWAKMYSKIWNHTYGKGEKALAAKVSADKYTSFVNNTLDYVDDYEKFVYEGPDDDTSSDEGEDIENTHIDYTNGSTSLIKPMCACPGIHHKGGAPICSSWRASVIARLRCERVVGGRDSRWGKHAIIPRKVVGEEVERSKDDEDDNVNKYTVRYLKMHSSNNAVQCDYNCLRDGIADMVIWASKKLPKVPVDFFPTFEVMLGSNRDEVTRVRDPQVTPFDWIAREAFCGREFVSEPEVILGSALELLSFIECRFPLRSEQFAPFVRRAVQPVFAILKLRYRSGSEEYIDGLVERTFELLRDKSLEDKDLMYAMYYDALLSFEYAKYLIEVRFDHKIIDEIISMRKEMKFDMKKLGINSFNEYNSIQTKYLDHSRLTYERLLKMLGSKDSESSAPKTYAPIYADELTINHVHKNLGDVYAYKCAITPNPSIVHSASEQAFNFYKSSRPLNNDTAVPPSILYAEASLHITLAQRTTGKVSLYHLDEASKILSDLAAEKWNPWNPLLVSESLGRVYTIKALLSSTNPNPNDSETLFLKARSEYQKSLRHEPALRNTHDSQSMAKYRRTCGTAGRIPLPSCGLVPDDLYVLLTRGYHELFQARFALSKKSNFYAITLLNQSKVMFDMACSFDPRGTAPIAGAAAVNAEIALLYPDTIPGNIAFESAEAQFAAITDVGGVYGHQSENAARAYLNYSLFLLFSAVSLGRCAESRSERLADALAAALIAMNMGSGYELAPVFVAAYAAFLLDMVDLCAALVARYNGVVMCEKGSRPLSPEVFASGVYDGADMNEFLWRFVI